MKSIYKFSFSPQDWVHLSMHKGAVIRAVQMQGDIPCVWAEIDTEQPYVTHLLRCFGTGHPFDDKNLLGHSKEHLDYIGTIQMFGGTLVLHIYNGGE